METLQISKENALKAHEEAGDKVKKVLENLLGRKVFLKSIEDRIKSYADACEDQNIKQLKLEDFSFLPEIDRKHAFASHRITTIIRSLNEGWTPDFNNSNEPKYYVWYKWVGSRAGFSFCDDDCDYSFSFVGARLHFKNAALAKYFAEQFIDDINEYFIL